MQKRARFFSDARAIYEMRNLYSFMESQYLGLASWLYETGLLLLLFITTPADHARHFYWLLHIVITRKYYSRRPQRRRSARSLVILFRPITSDAYLYERRAKARA